MIDPLLPQTLIDTQEQVGPKTSTETSAEPRLYLVVADQSPEMTVALRYACSRAQQIDGRVALFYAIEPSDINHWSAVDDAIMAEATTTAERTLAPFCDYVKTTTAHTAVVYLTRGDTRLELLALLQQHPELSVLVLGAHTGAKGPGPLVTYLTSVKGIRKLKVPLIIVPDTYRLETDHLLV